MIVECQMCFNLHNITIWNETDIYICQICADILSEIRKDEIKLENQGVKMSNTFRLALFDMKRDNIRDDKNE